MADCLGVLGVEGLLETVAHPGARPVGGGTPMSGAANLGSNQGGHGIVGPLFGIVGVDKSQVVHVEQLDDGTLDTVLRLADNGAATDHKHLIGIGRGTDMVVAAVSAVSRVGLDPFEGREGEDVDVIRSVGVVGSGGVDATVEVNVIGTVIGSGGQDGAETRKRRGGRAGSVLSIPG